MTSFEEVAPAKRRRLIAAGLLRALSATVLLVVAYYLLPVRNLSDARSAVELVVGMLAVVLLLVWEARAILKAAYPGVKAVEALATIVPLFLLLFASAYYLIERATPEQFRPTPVAHRCLVLHRDHLLYCWLRRYHRQERRARVVVIFQMLADLIILGFGLKVIFGAVQMGRQRRLGGSVDGSSAPAGTVSGGPGQHELAAGNAESQEVQREPE